MVAEAVTQVAATPAGGGGDRAGGAPKGVVASSDPSRLTGRKGAKTSVKAPFLRLTNRPEPATIKALLRSLDISTLLWPPVDGGLSFRI